MLLCCTPRLHLAATGPGRGRCSKLRRGRSLQRSTHEVQCPGCGRSRVTRGCHLLPGVLSFSGRRDAPLRRGLTINCKHQAFPPRGAKHGGWPLISEPWPLGVLSFKTITPKGSQQVPAFSLAKRVSPVSLRRHPRQWVQESNSTSC